jgi:hypothetical protein
MKTRLASAMALGLFLTPLAAAPVYAEMAGEQFRTATPQTFSSEDLQRYGLDADAADRAVTYQDQGYTVMVMTPEEAEQYTAGMTDNEWLMVGILIGVVVIAVAVA